MVGGRRESSNLGRVGTPGYAVKQFNEVGAENINVEIVDVHHNTDIRISTKCARNTNCKSEEDKITCLSVGFVLENDVCFFLINFRAFFLSGIPLSYSDYVRRDNENSVRTNQSYYSQLQY